MTRDEKPKNAVVRFLDQLRTSQLLMVLTGLLVLDLAVLDPLPFIDEIVLGLATLLVARWKMRSSSPQPMAEAVSKPPLKNVTPPDEHEEAG